MKKIEGISWILDRPHTEIEELKRKYPDHKEYLKHVFVYNDEKYRQNIEFVHSLGLKCDCVGWSYLDFDRPDVAEILDKIEKFCREGNWLARGSYSCRYVDFESDWYEIHAPSVEGVSKDEGIPYAIYAYKNRNKPILLGWSNFVPALVSEKFRDVCIKNNIQDVDFCWAKDDGRYDSMQYAFMYPENILKTLACDYGLRYSDEYFPYSDGSGGTVYKHTGNYKRHDSGSELYERLQQLGEYLPRLAEVFYNFQFNLQDYYYKKELPETGFAFIQGYNDVNKKNAILVHKDTAEILIKEKMLDSKSLYPVMIYDGEIPAGYVEAIFKDERFEYFDPKLAAVMEEEYHRIKSIKRPQRKATTNMALKALREAKREHKESFGKRTTKELSEALLETAYAPLVPYFLVADGGILSDEYQFLDYSSAKTQSLDLIKNINQEELVDIPTGIVFCKCADGDRVILTQNGNVLRVSHEVPDVLEEWPSLAQFFVDTLEEN